MEEPVDIKDIPLPGEEFETEIIESSQNDNGHVFGKSTKPFENDIKPIATSDNSVENDVNNVADKFENIDNNTVDILSQVISEEVCREFTTNNEINENYEDISSMQLNEEQIVIEEKTEKINEIETIDDAVKCVDNILADTVEHIANSESDITEIQQQIETVSIVEEQIVELPNTESALTESNSQESDVKQEISQDIQILDDSKNQVENENMESSCESFTLTLNVTDTNNTTNDEHSASNMHENTDSEMTIEKQMEKITSNNETSAASEPVPEAPETTEPNIEVPDETVQDLPATNEDVVDSIENHVEPQQNNNGTTEEPPTVQTEQATIKSPKQVKMEKLQVEIEPQEEIVTEEANKEISKNTESPRLNKPITKIEQNVEVIDSETVYMVEELSEPIVVSQNDITNQTQLVEKPKLKKLIEKPKKHIKDESLANIPCHVLGRNIDNPQEDLVSNGRTPPKPRLGVKVPYRHLTSQIVSQSDLTKELIERVSKRNPDPDLPPGGDIFFAQKLTQRLASKIALKSPQLASLDVSASKTQASNSAASRNQAIGDKQDLLAILEGDVDVDWTKEVQKSTKTCDGSPPVLTKEHVTMVKPEASGTPPTLQPALTQTNRAPGTRYANIPSEIEKIIALKQLESFPRRSGRRKQNLQEQVRERLVEEKPASPEVKPLKPKKELPDMSKTTAVPEAVTDKAQEAKPVTSSPAKKKITKTVIKTEDKPAAEAEESLTVTRRKITKTYSRKEPILEVPEEVVQIIDEQNLETRRQANETKDQKSEEKEQSSGDEKSKATKKTKRIMADKDINKPEITLVSKRARIIKRKVIWDPDEVPTRKSVSPTKKPTGDSDKAKAPTNKADDVPEEALEEVVEKPKKVTKMLTKAKVLRLRKAGKHVLLKKKLKPGLVRAANGEVKKAMSVLKKKLIVKKKEKKTELDKLLMDEGAVNMLFNVRQATPNRKKPTSQKDLITRAKLVKDVITMSSSQSDTPKALRNKEGPIKSKPSPQRKKSRDSVRSSIQSPPPSPSFMYPRRAEASRIIRRHSNSFSSEGSENEDKRRPSIDQNDKDTEEKDKEAPKRKKGVPIFIRKAEEKTYKGKRKGSNDSKTSEKQNKTDKLNEKLTSAEKRKLSSEMSKNFSQQAPKKRTRSSMNSVEAENAKSVKSSPQKARKTDKFSELVKNNQTEEKRSSSRQVALASSYKEITVRKIDSLVQIVLTPTTTKIKNAINLQMFNELCEVLYKLSKDDSCRVVLVSSTDNYFCHGIDFSTLIQANSEKRLARAQEMAKGLKEFLNALASFPKPLVAGVQGPALGLGVTMLPLFDLVLASDKATFATPYGRLGQIPEGAVFLTSPHIRGSVLTSELLFACRKLTASEALQHGLVTRVLWPDKFQEELIPIAQSITKQSTQCMLATKSILRQGLLSNLSATLETENKRLVEHWTSAECQQNFKQMLQENEWW